MTDSLVEVCVEDIQSLDCDLKIQILPNKTVSDIKQLVNMPRDKLCLVYEGRLLRDHESVSDIIESMNNVDCDAKKSIKITLIHTAPERDKQQHYTSSRHLQRDKEMTEVSPPLVVDPLSVNVAKAFLLNSRGASQSDDITHSTALLQSQYDSIISNPRLEVLPHSPLDDKLSHFPDSPTLNHTNAELEQHLPVLHDDIRGPGGNDGVPLPALPAALLQLEEEEEFPNLIRFQVVFRIAFALMIFGRDYETSVLATASFFYYFYEVGLWGYLYRRYCPQVATPPPPPAAAARNGQGVAGIQARVPGHHDPVQIQQEQGWSVGRLLHLLQTPPVVPRGTGPAKDVLALLLAFFCSLFPTWNME